jgi:hypothetical protein
VCEHLLRDRRLAASAGSCRWPRLPARRAGEPAPPAGRQPTIRSARHPTGGEGLTRCGRLTAADAAAAPRRPARGARHPSCRARSWRRSTRSDSGPWACNSPERLRGGSGGNSSDDRRASRRPFRRAMPSSIMTSANVSAITARGWAHDLADASPTPAVRRSAGTGIRLAADLDADVSHEALR